MVCCCMALLTVEIFSIIQKNAYSMLLLCIYLSLIPLLISLINVCYPFVCKTANYRGSLALAQFFILIGIGLGLGTNGRFLSTTTTSVGPAFAGLGEIQMQAALPLRALLYVERLFPVDPLKSFVTSRELYAWSIFYSPSKKWV